LYEKRKGAIMVPLDLNHPPLCSVDFPLELTPDEIVSLSGPINTLLKSSYLLGAAFETDAIFNSLFDIAEEIAQVEACGHLRHSEVGPTGWEVAILRSPGPPPDPEHAVHHVAPGAIACHFGKTVLLDPEREESFRETCDAWGSRSLLSCPLRRDRDIVGALVFGKKKSHPFTNVQVKLLWALAMQAQNHLQRNESISAKSVYSFLEP
jgi:hypothetical protein